MADCSYTICPNGKDQKVFIKDVKLHRDMCGWSLDITYTIETPSEIMELHIPRLMLPISNKKITIDVNHDYYDDSLCTGNIGFGNCRMLSDDNDQFYTIKTIETKTKEMTLDEIERKLGHKVKIVSKEASK